MAGVHPSDEEVAGRGENEDRPSCAPMAAGNNGRVALSSEPDVDTPEPNTAERGPDDDREISGRPREGASSSGTVPRRRRRREIGGGSDGTEGSQAVPAWMLTAVVAGSVLAIGTVHLPVLAVVAAISFAAAVIALRRQAEARGGILVPLPAIVLAALAAYTLLQAIPLPMKVLAAIAPSNADVWQRCLLPFGESGPPWAPISLDPGATLVEVLKWSTYAAVFVVASAVGGKHGAGRGVAIVFGAALAAALVTLGHGLLGITKVYGLYQPTFQTLAWHVGPLLNPNNLAGYLNLGALCGIGLLLSHRPALPRWLVGPGVALIVGIEVTSASRAGVAALPAAVIALALISRARKRDRREGDPRSAWLGVAAMLGGAIFAILGGNQQAWRELADKNLSKLEMILWAKPLVHDHPIFGVGRGAFETAFPVYRSVRGYNLYTHLENFAGQWVAEWGLPVGLGAIVLFAWAFAPRRMGVGRSELAAAAWVGVVALILQNLVDLALEVPAVCIGAVTVLGALWGDTRYHGTGRGVAVTGPVRAAALSYGVGAVGAAAIAVAIAFGWHDVASDRAAVRAALDAAKPLRPEQAAPIRAAIHKAMLAHPAEPYFPLVGGLLAHRLRDQSAIPWIQRTLERGQVNGHAHLLLAEVLASRGAVKQALLELRLTIENDALLLTQAASMATRRARTFEELLTAVPEGKEGATVLAEMGRLLSAPPGNPELRAQCDREAIHRDPTLLDPHAREAEARLQALIAMGPQAAPNPRPGGPAGLCDDRAHCTREILDHADAIERAHPDASLPLELRARVLMVEGKPDQAVKLLEKGCDQVTDRARCVRVRVQAAAAVKAPAMLEAAGKELLGATCISPQSCADSADWLASIRLARNEQGAALALLARAAREDPTNEQRWLRVADLASKSGAHVQAADALDKVSKHRGGADPALKARIEQERAQALGGLLPR
jgi:tetratricopeptide (TPR) repeat protein